MEAKSAGVDNPLYQNFKKESEPVSVLKFNFILC